MAQSASALASNLAGSGKFTELRQRLLLLPGSSVTFRCKCPSGLSL